MPDPAPSQPVAIITGAGRGIGRAVAVALRELGYRLVLVSRTELELAETKRLAGSGEIRVADVAKPTSGKQIVDCAMSSFGRIDAIVHCAGIAPVLSIENTSDEQWHDVLDTNLSAAFYLCRAAWGVFKRQGGGVVINISSFASRDPFPGFLAYGSAKAGLNLFGLALAREGASINVRVHTIAPGAVETAMFRTIMTQEQFPTEKTLSPRDVANVVVQCIRGDLKYTSGEVIFLSVPH